MYCTLKLYLETLGKYIGGKPHYNPKKLMGYFNFSIFGSNKGQVKIFGGAFFEESTVTTFIDSREWG